MNGTTSKKFHEKLLDFSFSEFITASIIKILYILGIICSGLVGLGILIYGLTQGGVQAFLGLVVAPVYFVMAVIWLRVSLEMVIVIFRIGENTAIIARGPGASIPPADNLPPK